jgi:succinate dehydrogenase assembly factor 2
MPFSKGVDLNSPSQSDALEDYGAPIRVPGREPGDESREQIIRRLIYQTRKRGILETDLLMSTFASKELWDMPDKEIAEFDKLLDEPDWDIYYWLVDKKPVPDRWRESFETEGRLGARLRKHTKNEEKEVRWMPDEPPVEK